MNKPPQEIANLPVNSSEKRQWLLTASARDIQVFINGIADNPYAAKEYELARTALEVRISDDCLKSAEILEHHTVKLISLTRNLVWLTAALLVFTICLAIRH